MNRKNSKNKVLTFLLFVVKINCVGYFPLNDQETNVVRACMSFMQGAMSPLGIVDGMPTAFCSNPKAVSYPLKFAPGPFEGHIKAFLDETIDVIDQTQNAMLQILAAFMHEKFAELEPEKGGVHLAKAKELYELGASDDNIARITASNTPNTIKMREICEALKLTGLDSLTQEQKEKLHAIQDRVCGYYHAALTHQLELEGPHNGYEIGDSNKLIAEQLLAQPLQWDMFPIKVLSISLIMATLSIRRLQVFAPFINQITDTNGHLYFDVSKCGDWSSMLYACDRLYALKQP